jgi:ubiquinone/menaquinone biosynthesis C-methylase UbiE
MGDRPGDWDSMAVWLDDKHQDEGDLWHRALIDPPVLRLLGDVAGRRLLDLACGNGYLARKLARLGADVVGVDGSPALIDLAQRREARDRLGIAYHVADAAHLGVLEDAMFDLVVCHMALMDIEDAAGAIREVARVLSPEGRFIASLSHPCFDVINASAWVVERMGFDETVWRKVSRYREASLGRCPWRIGPDVLHHTVAYHRPLSWYFRAFRCAGLAVTALEEPEPTGEFLEGSPRGAWIAQIPLHLVVEARHWR